MNHVTKHLARSIALVAIIFLLWNDSAFTQIITTIAGTGLGTYNGDSIPASQAQFLPNVIAYDKPGNLYFADPDDSRVRKIDRNRIVTTVAGNGISGFKGDGGLAVEASLGYPWGIALDSSGGLFICDDGESRIRLVKNGIIKTIAGIDSVTGGGYNGDSILAINARLNHPACIALDTAGNLYISDQGSRIRKITTDGLISTIAGTGVSGYSGDSGPAVKALIGDPIGIAVDNNGNIYFTDVEYQVVRRIDKNGIITTVAGTATVGYSGDGGPARLATLNNPFGVAVNKDGTLLIADSYNHVIRSVDQNGTITTIIGDGIPGFNGDGGPAKNARLNYPVSMAFDEMDNLVIADYGNARIRKVVAAPLAIGVRKFDVLKLENQVKINWQASGEMTVAYFTVQRSSDGDKFGTIATVSTKTNEGNTEDYSIVDEEASKLGVNNLYYRLTTTDKSGNTTYSKTVKVTLGNTRLTVYPNPVAEWLEINISATRNETIEVRVVDLQGKVLKRIRMQQQNGTNHYKINVKELAKGSYTIAINGTNVLYRKFLKL